MHTPTNRHLKYSESCPSVDMIQRISCNCMKFSGTTRTAWVTLYDNVSQVLVKLNIIRQFSPCWVMPLVIHSVVEWIASYIVCYETAEGRDTELIWPIFPYCLCRVQIITYSVFHPQPAAATVAWSAGQWTAILKLCNCSVGKTFIRVCYWFECRLKLLIQGSVGMLIKC